jgi:broad specificity phosphatase PhoE
MEILLVRHGKSVQSGGGHHDIPLSADGELQAVKTSKMLEGYGISKLYSSPLSRALKTAEIIASPLQLLPIVNMNLMERSDGIFDGLTREQSIERFPVEYAKLQANPLDSAPKGESFKDVKGRVDKFISDVVNTEEDGIIACVSHGGLLNTLLMAMLKMPDALYPLFRFENASVSSVAIDTSGKALINYINRLPS